MASTNPSSPSTTPPSDSSESAEGSLARHLHPADLRGAAQLATEGTLEGTRLVEAIHAVVLGILRPGPTRSRTTGLTGWIYRTVRRITRFSGWVATSVLGASEQMMEPAPRPHSRGRHQLLSVLNGVMGDHLAASGSPLARSFSLRTPEGIPIDVDAPRSTASDPLVVFVHGLCLSDRVWTEEADGRPALVEAITETVGGTPTLVRYNTGRPIWANGRSLSEHLTRWGPSRIVFVTHSMGGLVARSAIRYARRTSARWPNLVTETIYLGTPHRGAPLERTGAWVEEQLRRTPLTAPFGTLATLRSRGIQDLRHGSIVPNEAASTSTQRDTRKASPGRALYVAGALGNGLPTRAVVGDGLVPVSSALNGPDAPPRSTRRVVENVGHLALLRTPAVTEDLCRWLSRSARS